MLFVYHAEYDADQLSTLFENMRTMNPFYETCLMKD